MVQNKNELLILYYTGGHRVRVVGHEKCKQQRSCPSGKDTLIHFVL